MTKLLHVLSEIFETTLEEDIASLIMRICYEYNEYLNIAIYQVPEDLDIKVWRDNTIGPIFGYNESHLLPFISDPTKKIKGGFVILKDKKLIYQPRAVILNQQRDSFLWSCAQNKFYVPMSALGLVNEFIKNGYQLFKYEPDVSNFRYPQAIYLPTNTFYFDKNILVPIYLESLKSF